MSRALALWRVPSADVSEPRWHVAPWVDTLAYAFSWIFALIPMALVGDSHRVDYLYVYLVVLALTDVHRHYGLPYIYLDREIFGAHPLRFTLFPLVMLMLFLASPLLLRSGITLSAVGITAALAGVVWLLQLLSRDRADTRPSPAVFAAMIGAGVAVGGVAFGAFRAIGGEGAWAVLVGIVAASLALDFGTLTRARPRFVAPILIVLGLVAVALFGRHVPTFRMRGLLNFLAVAAGAWNIWHVYMQKYGILRLYNAKNGQAAKVPGWVDRALLWCWLPLYFLRIGVDYRTTLDQLFPGGRQTLGPLLDAVAVAAPYVKLPAFVGVAGSIALFIFYERRVNGLRNAPRLVMAGGTTLLAASFLFVHPLKAYLAFAFSHAVEYMVFVWAFQRRRYREPLAHRPLIARFLRFPISAYLLSALSLAMLFVYLKYFGRYLFPDQPRPRAFGYSALELVGYWTIYQSMVHFYFDGFLWKMRHASTRAVIGAMGTSESSTRLREI